MSSSSFDLKRIDVELYSNLQTPRSAVAFQRMSKEYIDYLLSDPHLRPGWQSTREIDAAKRFFSLVNNDRAWPLVQRCVPAFQTPANITDRNNPLCILLEKLSPRLQAGINDTFTRLQDIERYEAELIWKRFQAYVTYSSKLILDEEPHNLTPGRQEVTEDLLRELMKALIASRKFGKKD